MVIKLKTRLIVLLFLTSSISAFSQNPLNITKSNQDNGNKIYVAQEVDIEANKGIDTNTIVFSVSNFSSQDIWFCTSGFARVDVKNQTGFKVSPKRKIEANPIDLPNFILIKAKSIQDILYPVDQILEQYDLSSKENYILYFEYENNIKKKKLR
ncbi:hypothetical protein CW751_00560 [Brumimicrobium salinarum]|uniref:Uncharacterized protein n=1 Tax=Brumimicrobium salinarum TaxID=2058658 RepID=A0A2I0R5L2_9FLAO|nr:hypothetical protein [Brumimicrobium salinarum]PKR81863.1 hypothetical protein CW751_00560 [Brumimicrobium salinarum]